MRPDGVAVDWFVDNRNEQWGIGGGDGVDGQLVIFHDLTGLFWEFKSKFVKRYCEAGKIIQDALEQYVDEVKNGVFPSSENFYEIKEDELEKLLGDDKWKYEQDRVENNALPNHSVTPITSNKNSDIKRSKAIKENPRDKFPEY